MHFFNPTLLLRPEDLVCALRMAFGSYLLLILLGLSFRAFLKIPIQEFDAPERMVDILISSCLLILTLPVLLVISLIVKISHKGPIFVRSTSCGIRYGLDGELFGLWRFRTMKVFEEPALFSYTLIARDLRITPFGRILKQTGLDRLPELINVFLGHMAFVGPKALLPKEAEQVKSKYPNRFEVKPGFISPWLVERYNFKAGKIVRIWDKEKWLDTEEMYALYRQPMVRAAKMAFFLGFQVLRFFLPLQEMPAKRSPRKTVVATNGVKEPSPIMAPNRSYTVGLFAIAITPSVYVVVTAIRSIAIFLKLI